MKLKRDILFLFCILAGTIVGALVANFAAQIPSVSWLGFGRSIGLSADSPMVLDLLIIRLAFGFEMKINVAQILTILGSIFVYKGLVKKL